MTTNDKMLDEMPPATCEPSRNCDVESFEIQKGDIKIPPNRASFMMQAFCSLHELVARAMRQLNFFNSAYSGTHETFLYSGKISEAFVHCTFISPLKCCTIILNFFLGFPNARFPQKLSLKCFVNVHTLGFLYFNLSTLLTVQSA